VNPTTAVCTCDYGTGADRCLCGEVYQSTEASGATTRRGVELFFLPRWDGERQRAGHCRGYGRRRAGDGSDQFRAGRHRRTSSHHWSDPERAQWPAERVFFAHIDTPTQFQARVRWVLTRPISAAMVRMGDQHRDRHVLNTYLPAIRTPPTSRFTPRCRLHSTERGWAEHRRVAVKLQTASDCAFDA